MTNEEYRIHYEAMRAQLAGQAFCGLVALPRNAQNGTASVAKQAVRAADALLEELAKPPGEGGAS
jgi:hypothetical protein